MIQLQVLNYLLQTKDSSMIVMNTLDDSFFSDYKEEFNFIKNHLEKYNVIPDELTFYTQFPKFDAIEVHESSDYLIDELFEDKNTRVIASAFNKVRESLNNGDNSGAEDAIRQVAENLSTAKHLNSVDVLRSFERHQDYLERLEFHDKYYIKTGFKELDDIIGGWDCTEEYGIIMARAGVGKSWTLTRCAVAAAEQGKRVGYYSGEMSEKKVGYRVDTLISHVSNWDLTKGKDASQVAYKLHLEKLASTFNDNHTGCLKVITPQSLGRMATVDDLRAFIEKENLEILFVDQFSLMEDQRHGRESFTKLANISKDIKALQVLKQVPIICASQQNRGETTNGISVANIAGSDRLGQDATTVLAIERDNEDDNIFIVDVIKSRDSVVGDKLRYRVKLNTGEFDYIPSDDTSIRSDEDITNDNLDDLITQSYEEVQW